METSKAERKLGKKKRKGILGHLDAIEAQMDMKWPTNGTSDEQRELKACHERYLVCVAKQLDTYLREWYALAEMQLEGKHVTYLSIERATVDSLESKGTERGTYEAPIPEGGDDSAPLT